MDLCRELDIPVEEKQVTPEESETGRCSSLLRYSRGWESATMFLSQTLGRYPGQGNPGCLQSLVIEKTYKRNLEVA